MYLHFATSWFTTRWSLSGKCLFVLIFLAWTCGVAAEDVPLTQFEQMPVKEPVVTATAVANGTVERVQLDVRQGPLPHWIWGSTKDIEETYWLRTTFEGGCKSASLLGVGDNTLEVFINGKPVVASESLDQPIGVRIDHKIQEGTNELSVRCQNYGGPGAVILKIAMQLEDGSWRYVITDDSWEATHDPETMPWAPVYDFGALEDTLWDKKVFDSFQEALLPLAKRDVFQVLPGFEVERLVDVPRTSFGSWVCLAFDPQGRLLASDERGAGIARITPAPIGSDQPTRVEKLPLDITGAQGLLCAFDSLYILASGTPSRLYRVRDTNGDDQYDEVEILREIAGAGEHGPHALRLSPDGKWIYMIAGNFTDMPAYTQSRVPLQWGEDHLLPRQHDPSGFSKDRLAPGGFVCRFDPNGNDLEIVTTGFRNPYDFDFSPEGDLFTFDADMEDDMGTSWYRPTRVCLVASGIDYGWRNGSGKFPEYYADTLPATLNVGPGSPVGVKFGAGTRFPAAYQRALFVLDWSYGTMYALHLEGTGAGWTARSEEFLSRTPLPLTDAEVGPDGALYFTMGGRGVPSALFRVTYTGDESVSPIAIGEDESIHRRMRRRLETLHESDLATADDLAFARGFLGSEDRWLRYAARVALEHQPSELWQEEVLRLSAPRALVTGVVALARVGDSSLTARLLDKLNSIEFGSLPTSVKLEMLRAYALVFIRGSEIDDATRASIEAKLTGHFPADSKSLNRELSRVLVYLGSPTVIEKTLDLMQPTEKQSLDEMVALLSRNDRLGGKIAKMLDNQPEIQNVHYAHMLSGIRYGWTLAQRQKLFAWLGQAAAQNGGRSYQGYIANIRQRALDNVAEKERAQLQTEFQPEVVQAAGLPQPIGPGRSWTVADIVARTSAGIHSRSFENGRRAFAAAKCIQCHRFDGEGGATGPDLGNLAGRFSIQAIAEAVVQPSKVIPDRYQGTIVVDRDGKIHTGRMTARSEEKITLLTDAYDPNKSTVILTRDIEEMRPSPTSLMPDKLADVLNEDELLDLLAYLLSRGNPDDRVFLPN
ncbi:MAG: c-type cytochrome [Pirellulaceae bacterium]|nr:c-type cytochrome [Pirellulaceae bacterium]